MNSRIRSVILFFFILFSSHIMAQKERVNLDSIYDALSEVLSRSNDFIKLKEDTIKIKTYAFQHIVNKEDQFEAALELYKEYRFYDNDSALVYLFRCLNLAQSIQDKRRSAATMLRIGHQYVVSGYYYEAEEYFKKVSTEDLDTSLLPTYYHYYSHFYRELEKFTIDVNLKKRYEELSRMFNDSLEMVSSRDNALYYQRRCISLCSEGRYDEAKNINDEWMKWVEEGSVGYSLMAYYRAEICGNKQQYDEQKYWLAVSAIAEIESCDMNQTSLWNLAEIIYKDGDINRARKYIEFSWDHISRFSTHKRGWIMAPIMNEIPKEYQAKITLSNMSLLVLAAAMGLLALGLLAAFFYARHERRIAIEARESLQKTNQQLQTLNNQLGETNRVKDEYIRDFLQMCSSYIDKMDKYRVRVNQKLKANQVKDLIRMTSSEQLKKDEHDELMKHFDTVFLHLFPSFVNDFNELLLPESRIYPKEPGRLNTILRIFALVRLGIEESSKIADFLDYNANSIYSYRSRTKNQAVHKETFDEDVMKLSTINRA